MVRYARIVIAATLSVLPLLVALNTPAYACSCAPIDLEERVAEADAIVVGTPVAREIAGPEPTPPPLSPPTFSPVGVVVDTTLNISEYVKGAGDESLNVRTDGELFFDETGGPQLLEGLSASCSYTPELNTEYIFFLYRRDDGELTAHPCSGVYAVDQELIAQIRGLLQPATATPTSGTPTALPGTTTPSPATATPLAGQLPSTGTGQSGGRSIPWGAAAAVAAGVGLGAAALLGLRRRGS